MPPDRPVVTLRLPFGLRTRRKAEGAPTADPSTPEAGNLGQNTGRGVPADGRRRGRPVRGSARRPAPRAAVHSSSAPPMSVADADATWTERRRRWCGWPSPRRSRPAPPPSRTPLSRRSKAASIRRRAGAPPATLTSSPPRCGWSARATPRGRRGRRPACSTPARCSAPRTRFASRRSSRACTARSSRCRRPRRSRRQAAGTRRCCSSSTTTRRWRASCRSRPRCAAGGPRSCAICSRRSTTRRR